MTLGFGSHRPEPIVCLAEIPGRMMKKSGAGWIPAVVLVLGLAGPGSAQNQPSLPVPDERYKADALVVVAHPDDDTAVSTYLAKAVFDEGKRVAIVFTNRGNAGPNAIGMEQSKALADVREMEARRSLAERGITNVWFLNGQDTPTQDVLHSLETLGHGEALEDIVRLIRLTRPEVILTWMPAYVAGENHGDHQASGVVAVEAMDMAGDSTAFAAQLTAPRWHGGVGNYGEGLHPWQVKKIYFFSDASHPDFLKGHGPTYLASDICQSKKISFAEINRQAWRHYATQLDFDQQTLSYFVNMPEYLVQGKSLVSAPTEGDVWGGIDNKPASFSPAPGHKPASANAVTFDLGGPWAFYREFYPAHGLKPLEGLVPPQSSLSYGNQLWLPLLLRNGTSRAVELSVRADLPVGWSGDTKQGLYHLDPHSTYPIEVFLAAPSGSDQKSPQTLNWVATGNGLPQKISIAVYMEFDGVSQ
jgi:LmbE family N-acetylglucosaminyl deacetylase